MITWDLFITYLRDVKNLNVSRKNRNTYHSRFLNAYNFFLKKPFNRYTCDEYLALFHDKANATRNNALKILKNICSGMRYYKMEEDAVLKNIESIQYLKKVRLRQIDVLTSSEIWKLAEVRMPYKMSFVKTNLRWRAVIYTLALGLRVSELTDAKWFDLKADHLIIHEGKTPNAQRRIYIPPKLHKDIMKLDHYSHGFIFGSHRGQLNRDYISRDLKKRAVAVGIKKLIYPHVLRHSFITNSIIAGVPLAFIAAHVGHKSYDVTAEYVHLTLSQTKQAVEANPLYRSGAYTHIKEVLKDTIDRVYDKDKLKAIQTLLLQDGQ